MVSALRAGFRSALATDRVVARKARDATRAAPARLLGTTALATLLIPLSVLLWPSVLRSALPLVRATTYRHGVATHSTFLVLSLVAAVVVVLICLMAVVAGSGMIAVLLAGALRDRASVAQACGRGLRRAPVGMASLGLLLVAAALLAVLSPLVSLAALVAIVRRRRAARPLGMLPLLVVPGTAALAALVLVPLVVPAAALGRGGPITVIRRTLRVVRSAGAGVALPVLTTLAGVAAFAAFSGRLPGGAILPGVALTLLVCELPLCMLVVHAVPDELAPPPRPRRWTSVMSWGRVPLPGAAVVVMLLALVATVLPPPTQALASTVLAPPPTTATGVSRTVPGTGSVPAGPTSFTATVAGADLVHAPGTVLFEAFGGTADGVDSQVIPLGANGLARAVFDLTPGEHAIHATYQPDPADPAGSSSTDAIQFIVATPSATTTTVTDPGASIAGDAVPLTFRVVAADASAPSGRVTVTEAGRAVANADVSLRRLVLPGTESAGSHTYTVTFVPADGRLLTSESSLVHLVRPATIRRLVITPSDLSPLAGQTISVTVNIGPTSGPVPALHAELSDVGKILLSRDFPFNPTGSDQDTVVLTNLPAGAHPLVLTVSGPNVSSQQAGPVTVTVTGTTQVLTSLPAGPYVYGTSVPVGLQLLSGVGGTVVATEAGVEVARVVIGTGPLLLPVTGTGPRTYALTLNGTSLPDVHFIGSAAPTRLQLGPVPDGTIGSPIALSATLFSAVPPTGVVTFSIGSRSVQAHVGPTGVATASVIPNAVGTLPVTASFTGVDRLPSSDTGAAAVGRAPVQLQTAQVSSNPVAGTVGVSVSLVSAQPLTGVVTAGVPLGSTVTATITSAAVTVVNVPVPTGSSSVRTVFAGDATHEPAESVVTVQRSLPAAHVGLIASPTAVSYGEPVLLQAPVESQIPGPGMTSGTVVFRSNGVVLGSATLDPLNGTARLSTAGLPVGADVVSATYSGDARNGPATGTTTVQVSPASRLLISSTGPEQALHPTSLVVSTLPSGLPTSGPGPDPAHGRLVCNSPSWAQPLALDVVGQTGLTAVWQRRGPGTVSCSFTPIPGSPYLASTAVFEAVVQGDPVAITVLAPGARVGRPLTLQVTGTDNDPAPVPVTVTVGGNPQVCQGVLPLSCTLGAARERHLSVVVNVIGNNVHDPSTTRMPLDVAAGDTQLQATARLLPAVGAVTPGGRTDWEYGDSVAVTWSGAVGAPSNGTTTVTVNGAPVCSTPGSIEHPRSCLFLVRRELARNLAAVVLEVTYSDDPNWELQTARIVTSTVTACTSVVPTVTSDDAAGGPLGRVVVTGDLPCRGTTRYADDSLVHFHALPRPGYRFVGWSDGPLALDRDPQSLATVVNPRDLVVGTPIPVAVFVPNCQLVQTAGNAHVRVRVFGRTCPGTVPAEQLFQAGSVVTLVADVQAPDRIYSWYSQSGSGAAVVGRPNRFELLVKTDRDEVVLPNIGPRCVRPTLHQPLSAASAELIGPKSCHDPDGPGYLPGQLLTLRAHPGPNTLRAALRAQDWGVPTGQAVSASDVSDTATWAATDGEVFPKVTSCVSIALRFVVVSDDRDAPFTPHGTLTNRADTRCSAFGLFPVDNSSRYGGPDVADAVDVHVDRPPLAPPIVIGGPDWNGNYRYAPDPIDYQAPYKMYLTSDVLLCHPGTSGCELPPPNLYDAGQVSDPLGALDRTVGAPTTSSSATITVHLYRLGDCVPVPRLLAAPGTSMTLELGTQANPCPPGGVPTGANAAVRVRGVLHPDLYGQHLSWQDNRRIGQIEDQSVDPESDGSLLFPVVLHSHLVVAGAECQQFNVRMVFTYPNGVRQERAYLKRSDATTTPAPSCPWADNGYPLGTTVKVHLNSTPLGTFQDWTGAASGTSPDTTVVLDGKHPEESAVARLNGLCYRLTSRYDEPISVSPRPNCPAYPASEHMYLNGTEVTIRALAWRDHTMDGFVGDISAGEQGEFASFVMNRDRGVYAYFSYHSGAVLNLPGGFAELLQGESLISAAIIDEVAARVGGTLIVSAVDAAVAITRYTGQALAALGVSIPPGFESTLNDIAATADFYVNILHCAANFYDPTGTVRVGSDIAQIAKLAAKKNKTQINKASQLKKERALAAAADANQQSVADLASSIGDAGHITQSTNQLAGCLAQAIPDYLNVVPAADDYTLAF